MRYLVVVEKGPTSFGAYVPDLPGCIAAAETREEVLAQIREAIEFQIEGLKQDGQPIPPPSSSSEVVEVQAAYLADRADRSESGSSIRTLLHLPLHLPVIGSTSYRSLKLSHRRGACGWRR